MKTKDTFMHRIGEYLFTIAVVIEVLVVLVDKSNYTNPVQGRLFQLTFLLFLAKVCLTKYTFKGKGGCLCGFLQKYRYGEMFKAGILADAFRLPCHHSFVGNRDLRRGFAYPGLWERKRGDQIYPGDGTSQCLAVHGVVIIRIGIVFVWENDEMVALSGLTIGECLLLPPNRLQDKSSCNGAGDCYRSGSHTAEECFGGETVELVRYDHIIRKHWNIGFDRMQCIPGL